MNVGRQDLHVAREHHEIHLASKQAEERPLLLILRAGRYGEMVIRDAKRLHLASKVVMVRDHHRDLGLDLAAPPAPQQFEEAVVGLRHQERYPAAVCAVGHVPFHLEAARDLGAEPLRDLRGRRVEVLHLVLHAQEEPAASFVRGVLVRLDDVRAVLEQERGYRRHDARTVGALHQQSRGTRRCVSHVPDDRCAGGRRLCGLAIRRTRLG